MSEDIEITDDNSPDKAEEADFQQKKILCSKGQTIIEQGSPSHQAYYIIEGLVEVVIKDADYEIKLGEIGAGEIFGEMGILEEEGRQASVIALKGSKLAIINREDIEDRIKNVKDPIISSIITSLTRRLRDANNGQMVHYKNLTSFQNRVSGLMEKANEGIAPAQREEFSDEVTPLLDQLDTLLDKYKKS